MRRILLAIFSLILGAMLYVTVTASLAEGVFRAGARLWPDLWFRATLADAYFGFLAVFVWIAWRERSTAVRIGWFVLLMTLGNIAIAAYFLIALARLAPAAGIDGLYQRKPA